MSIKLLAKDLYRLQKEVERLEAQLETAPLNERIQLEALLRNTKAERTRLRRALDGKLHR